MEKLTEDQIRKQIDRLTEDQCRALAASLLDCLHGPASDLDWGADTLESIAGLLHVHKLGPDHVID